MPAIGITGGISTGKSTFRDCLREIIPAAKFFDADRAAHSLAEVPEVKQEILSEFGGEVFSPDGDLNRAKLRAIVYQRDQKALARTNSSPSDTSPVDGAGGKAS
jgi:Dephospho-CoA kinase